MEMGGGWGEGGWELGSSLQKNVSFTCCRTSSYQNSRLQYINSLKLYSSQLPFESSTDVQ